MADEQHQDDPTLGMSVDQKIQPNTQTAPPSFDISQPVVPGHDMVVNHLDGAQELATGNEATAIAAAEAERGENVPLSEVQGNVEPETQHRSVPDPETNQPTVSAPAPAPGEPAEEPTPPVTPEVTPEVETPAEPVETPTDTPAEPTSADVDGV